MKNLAVSFIVIVALSACSTQKKEESKVASLDSLLKAYHEEYLKLYPLEATSLGDARYNDILYNEITLEFRAKAKDFYTRYSDQLNAIDKNSLSENDQWSRDILLYECKNNIDAFQFNDHLMPISQFYSVTLQVAQLASGMGDQPFKTPKDYDNWLTRLDTYTQWCDTAMVNMRKGIKAGYVIPKALAVKVIPQLSNFDHGPVKDHLYYMPVKNIPSDFSPADKARIEQEYQEMINGRIIPIHQRLKTFIEKEYLPACRTTSGIDAVPAGKEMYAYLIRRYTTTNKTADEIFAIGKAEVDRISREMEGVKEQVGFKGDLKAFFNHLRAKKELMPFKSPEEVITRYNSIHEQMKPNLAKLFDQTPRMPFEVRRIEAFREATSAANYNVGSQDGSRPGIFYVPIRDYKTYSYIGMEDLFLHEAIPGHHYQIALKVENTSLPDFRRILNFGAYTEGWALYTEALGKELGLYTDPYSYFGMLSSEMHRAVRLVVDAGMHSQGWTREQAIQYSLDHEPIPEANAISEIERYMAIPGQALSYKMGQLKILELRAKAEKELGDKFDVKQFHNQVLDSGSLPLDLLETKINNWISSVKGAA